MRRGAIPEDVRQFILSSVPSVPYLEALLLLRNAPALSWDSAQLARRLYLSETTATDILDALCANGLAVCTPNTSACHYHPARPELAEMIDRLAQAYAVNLVGVSTLIHAHDAPQRPPGGSLGSRTHKP